MPTKSKIIDESSKLIQQDELGQRLIESAREIVCETGLETLTARSLCARAGCSLGAIYTRFRDMDEVLFYMNAKIFNELGLLIYKNCPETMAPRDRLCKLLEIYRNFASEQNNLWNAVFNRGVSKNQAFPAWYLERMGWFVEFMEKIIADLNPNASREDVKRLARTCYAAVHGITVMSSRRAFVNISNFDEKESMDLVIEKLITHSCPQNH